MLFDQLHNTLLENVGSGEQTSVLADCLTDRPLLFLAWPQLGDFDSVEYAWWLQRDAEKLAADQVQVRAVGIGDRRAGLKFCAYTGFNPDQLWIDPSASLHKTLGLYSGLSRSWPGLSPQGAAWFNLLLMCAGIGSPGTLKEVLRGYIGDRTAPQLIDDAETLTLNPFPRVNGKLFTAVGTGYQRPFELATLRLRNMVEVLGHWSSYVPNPAYMTQRGGTFLFDAQQQLIYEYRDRGILGFSETMANPLQFLDRLSTASVTVSA